MIMLIALVGSVIGLVGFGAAGAMAQVEGEGLQTTLQVDGDPVAGVTITVYTEDGDLVVSAETDEDGYWVVPVPESATYLVELDESTLPDGVALTSGNVREPLVRPGNVGNLLFGLTSGPAPPPSQPGDSDDPPGEPGEEVPEADIPDDPEEELEVVAGPGRWDRVVSHLYSGFHFGLIIALAALGLSMVFGTMGLINFAHGELVTFGAIAAFFVNVVGVTIFDFNITLHLIFAVPVAVALGMLFGYLQDRFFWGWLRKRGTGLIAMMIISIGVALLLRHVYLYFLGPGRRPYAQYTVQEPERFGPLAVLPKTMITDSIALVVLVGVALALVLTRFGKAIRAVADNPSLAAASGINVDRVIRIVWAIGTGLAALAGVFLAMHETTNYLMGFQMLLLIFAAVVVGGLGTAFGAIVGGLIVGVLIQVSTLWVPNEFKYVVALVLLIAVLLVRPQGLLGRRARIG
ncbi:branched-chain amino acid ABC transporter permease [Natronosporangium hydrolyticum]|uniref:Branched-chain amino acid ABC transporter permease n=1 Tax=Natronosporangium hydrolyticum TaxID=2811111 RepID=A0A895YIG0_9ACTN|nr:branched-chain amino acid ABC transporter permease [Natronosporangium hydrolyticum]